MFTQNISYHAAFVAGLLSFFSPCILPLIPAYFTLITGFSLDELTKPDKGNIRRKVIISTVAYILGFSTVFIILGASASFFGQMIQEYQSVIRIVGGHIICILGFHLLGVIHISGLDFEKRVHFHKKPLHFLGTFLIGMAFGAGWSPCIGPILGSIFILAANQDSIGKGIILLTLYSAGLALPFLLISFSIQSLLGWLSRAKRFIVYVNAISGSMLIIIGILLIINKLQILG
ncbi:cytochrome c-type biogenesis protein CcdA [Candidatus Magnetomorum sp. HK-1]|nr:cytochrome c-type biogenesis protein CcdA [Candidatus Magnetomorum sp. HK-1]